MEKKTWRPASLAAQALGWIDPITKAVSPPIHMSSTFIRDTDNEYRAGYGDIREENPAFAQAEALLTALENGAESRLFASGMSAATAVFLALRPGDHVVAPKVMYWGLRNWLIDFARSWGLIVDFADSDNPKSLEAAMRSGKTKLVWIETPANPMWGVTDIARSAEIAHRAGAILAVDSTVATPVLTKPLALGAEIVMHSATKYLNGHSDLSAGALIAAGKSEIWDRIGYNRNKLGTTLGSMEAWLLLRGMRSLFPRVERACRSAEILAVGLQNVAGVTQVLYPGLPDFPGHAIAKQQMSGGFGGMLSIRVKGGEAAAIAAAAKIELWKRATSLGGTESLIEHRASVEGPTSPVPPDLLRLSVGLEDPNDLLEDLKAAIG